jgi:PKD repeat protein
MAHVRSRALIAVAVLALTLAATGVASAQYTAADTLKAVAPGLVYREYARTMSAGNDWRVTDPNATNPGEPGNSPATFLPNPVLGLNVTDLEGAVRVVAVIDVWGGHVGTVGKRFRLNGNSWINIPDITGTPTSPECYTQQYTAYVEVPLSHLASGANTLEGNSGGQTCYNFGWGQWGWYGFMLRVYYDPQAKAAPGGNIMIPASGSTIGENPLFEVAATGAARVDIVGFYESHDTDGDGVLRDWQQSYHRLQGDAEFRVRNHIGTATAAPFRANWNTQWVPDQAPGGIMAVARIRDAGGLWYVTERVTGLTLARHDLSVRLYGPDLMPQNHWVRANRTVTTTFGIPAVHGLPLAQSARMFVATWNGPHAPPAGVTHWTRLNGQALPYYGTAYAYSYDGVDVPVANLQGGQNSISYFSSTTGHGIEVLWPGPAVVVRYVGLDTSPPVIAAEPQDATTVEGLTATFNVVAVGASPLAYRWQRDGIDIPGAQADTYTTPLLTAAASGGLYRCIVTNPAGTDTSRAALLTVPASGPRVEDGLLALYRFDEAAGNTIRDTAGAGDPVDLVIPTMGAVAWRPGSLVVQAPVLIATPGPATRLSEAIRASNALTVEAWLEPANLTQNGPARIVTLSSGTAGTNVTLGQGVFGASSDVFDVRLRATGTGTGGMPSLSTPPGTLQRRLTHVVYTRDAAGITRLWLDGTERATGSAPGDLSNWDTTFRFALANEMSGNRPWLGEYHLVAVYDRALPADDVARNYAAGPSANNLPVAVFTATPVEGTAPLTVDFDGTLSLGGAGAVVAWDWDFGDGATGSGPVTSRQYVYSGLYTAVLTVTNGDGGRAAADTTIVVTGPPAITVQPAPLTVDSWQAATFAVVAVGMPPLTYQWQKDGVDIPGALAASYTTAPAMLSLSGSAYRCVVTNPHGSVASADALLTVLPPPPRFATGLLALYTFREGAGNIVRDVSGFGDPLDLAIADTAAAAWGPAGLAITAPTRIASPGAAAKITASAQAAGQVTVEAWLTPANTTQLGPARIVSLAQDGSNRNLTLGQGLFGTLPSALYNVRLRTSTSDANGLPDLSSVDGSLSTRVTHVVFTYDAQGASRLYLDGALAATAGGGGSLGNWNPTYGLALANEYGIDRPWLGELHLVAFYGAALSPAQVLQNFVAGPVFAANAAPTARIAASRTSGLAPMAVEFSAAASTDPDGTIVDYAWDFGDGAIGAGATVSHSYAPGRHTATLTVTDSAGATAQAVVALAVSEARGIIRHPLDQAVGAGQPATFGVEAAAGAVFQWQRNGVDIAGATAATYTTPATTTADHGAAFTCLVVVADGQALASEPALLSVTGDTPDALPTAWALRPPYPNPFNPSTTIAFDLPEAATVRLEVFDVAGRLVDVVVRDVPFAAGRWRAVWQGRDGDGRGVAAGVYFCRLEAGAFSATMRMLLVK